MAPAFHESREQTLNVETQTREGEGGLGLFSVVLRKFASGGNKEHRDNHARLTEVALRSGGPGPKHIPGLPLLFRAVPQPRSPC